jgi:hypothetical protein
MYRLELTVDRAKTIDESDDFSEALDMCALYGNDFEGAQCGNDPNERILVYQNEKMIPLIKLLHVFKKFTISHIILSL